MDQDLKDFEAKLKDASPELMPEEMIKRMASAMDKWYEGTPSAEKIIPFEPLKEPEPQVVKSRLKFFNTWAQVAAVALMAAVSYLMLNQADPTNTATGQVASIEPLSQQVPMKNIESAVPASSSIQQLPSEFSSEVKRATQNIITFDANGRPMRLMQVEFEDEVIMRDRDGNPHVVKQPRIEYYAVPAEIH